jgi:hypothetical protein
VFARVASGLYAPDVDDGSSAFEEAVLAQAPPGAVVVGSAISPDGKYAVALTILPTATNYPMDDIFERIGKRWVGLSGGSGGGVGWTSLGDEGEGVLRLANEAPLGARAAVVAYEGREHRVPTREGWFFFVAWDTAYTEEPRLLRFE